MKLVTMKINTMPMVSIDDIDERNIYAYVGCMGNIYKLHRISESMGSEVKFAFVSLSDSRCYASGTHSSAKKAIEAALGWKDEVFEFDTEKEFLKWAYNNSRDDKPEWL